MDRVAERDVQVSKLQSKVYELKEALSTADQKKNRYKTELKQAMINESTMGEQQSVRSMMHSAHKSAMMTTSDRKNRKAANPAPSQISLPMSATLKTPISNSTSKLHSGEISK